jgi:hypothetical protein
VSSWGDCLTPVPPHLAVAPQSSSVNFEGGRMREGRHRWRWREERAQWVSGTLRSPPAHQQCNSGSESCQQVQPAPLPSSSFARFSLTSHASDRLCRSPVSLSTLWSTSCASSRTSSSRTRRSLDLISSRRIEGLRAVSRQQRCVEVLLDRLSVQRE